MAGQLGQIGVNVVDNLMVGRLGAASLAAVSLSVAIFVVFVVIGFGLSYALPPLVSEAHGADQHRRISMYFKHSLIINLSFAMISVVFIYISSPLLTYLGQDPEVVHLARPYLEISAWAMLPMMLFQTLRSYTDGMSKTLPAMTAIIIGNVFNVIFNYLFIFGKGGMPEMGVAGAALASLLARIVMIFTLLLLIWKSKELKSHIQDSRFSSYKRTYFIKIFNIGLPSSLQGFFEISAFSGASIIMGMIGKNAQAAHQIAINLASITFLICSGFAMAATIRVGNHLGSKDHKQLREIGIASFLQVAFFMTLCSIMFFVFRHQLPLLYIEDGFVTHISAALLFYAAIFQIPDGLQVTLLGALRGLQDVVWPTIISFTSYWILGIPISYLLAIVYEFGPSGVWIGLITGISASAILLNRRFLRKTNSLITSTHE